MVFASNSPNNNLQVQHMPMLEFSMKQSSESLSPKVPDLIFWLNEGSRVVRSSQSYIGSEIVSNVKFCLFK